MLKNETWHDDEDRMLVHSPIQAFCDQTTYIGVSVGKVEEGTQYSNLVSPSSPLHDFTRREVNAQTLHEVRGILSHRREGAYLYLFSHLAIHGKRINHGLVLTTLDHKLIAVWYLRPYQVTYHTIRDILDYISDGFDEEYAPYQQPSLAKKGA